MAASGIRRSLRIVSPCSMTNATATTDIRMMMTPMYPPALIESMKVRCLMPGLLDLLVDVADGSNESGPTLGLVSSCARSGERKAGCVMSWLTHQTAASASVKRKIEVHRTLPVEPAANFARRMSASSTIELLSAAFRPKMRARVSTGQFTPHRRCTLGIFELIECRCSVIETGRRQFRLLAAVNGRKRQQRQQAIAARVFICRSHVGQAQDKEACRTAKQR